MKKEQLNNYPLTKNWYELLEEHYSFFFAPNKEQDTQGVEETMFAVFNTGGHTSVMFGIKREFDRETIAVGNIRGEEEKEIAINVLVKRIEYLANGCDDTQRLSVDFSDVVDKEIVKVLSLKMKELREEQGLNIVIVKADKEIKKLEQTAEIKCNSLNCE